MRLAVLALLLLAALALPAAASASWRAPCTPGGGGPACTWWNARATFVEDGDTVDVAVEGRRQVIRFAGINAMELTHYAAQASRRRGDCHGVAAANIVDGAVRASHRRIRLAAQSPASRGAQGLRLRRAVWARVGGRWRDVSALVMEQGLALWMPDKIEYAHNREYRELAQAAIAAQRGLYDPASCGREPDADVPLSVSVNWDAEGDDLTNFNGEWIAVVNRGARAVPLGGWLLRTGGPWGSHPPAQGYPFPAGAVLPAGGTVRLHVGRGTADGENFYMGRDQAIFPNWTGAPLWTGDGGYLFDPHGALRAEQIC
jgi:endonuclease YncB( thermonuclease family)